MCKDPTVQKQSEFCEENFHKLRELMRHKKVPHEEKVQLCCNYASGTCDFGDEECWFSHEEKYEPIFKCNSCIHVEMVCVNMTTA